MTKPFGLLGLHVNSIVGGLPELLAAWRPAVVVTLARDGTWAWLKQVSPRTVVVMRAFDDDSHNPDLGQAFDDQGKPFNAAAKARELVVTGLRAVGAARFDYLQLTNEPVVTSADAMHRLADLECAMLQEATQRGVRLIIGNFGVGNPSDLDWWTIYEQALREGRKHRAVLGLHQYNWPVIQTSDDLWYTLRHRQVYQRLPADCCLPLILTETGLDAGVHEPGRVQGWQGHIEGRDYLEQLRQYDAALQADPYVIGAAVFMAGGADRWWSYNVWPELAADIGRTAEPVYRPVEALLGDVPGARQWGPDVSWWQGSAVDWRAVKRAGASFAILRASCGDVVDGKFARNYKNATAIGLPVEWCYHYLTGEGVPLQRETLCAALAACPVSRVWIDVEESGVMDAEVRAMCDGLAIRLPHVTVGIYTSWVMAQRAGLGAWAGNLPLWVADWRGKATPLMPGPWKGKEWTYWQYTSKGQVNGFSGRVDLNWKGV